MNGNTTSSHRTGRAGLPFGRADIVAVAAMAAFLALSLVLVAMLETDAWAKTVEAPWRLSVGTAAVAKGDRVLLGDIANPVGELSPTHWRRLAAIELWAAPAKPGDQEIVPRDKLQELLNYYLGDVGQLCVLSGQMVVQRGGRVILGPELERMVVETLTPQVSAMEGDVRLRDFRLPHQVFLGDAQSTLDIVVAGQFKPGRLSLAITEKDPAGNEGRRLTGTVFMDQWLSVPCAARPVNTHDRLGPEHVAFERKNSAFMSGDPWDGRSFGMRVKRPVGAGEVIYAKNLEEVPLVSRGDVVTLEFQGRFVHLSTNAKALSDGKLGERIPVRNMGSNREVIAEVVNADTVVVR